MNRKNPDFIIGVVLVLAGLFLLLKETYVFSWGFMHAGNVNVTAVIVLLMMASVTGMLIRPSKYFGYLLAALLVALIVSIVMNIRIGFFHMSSLEAVLIFGCIAAGAGLIIRTVIRA